MRYFMQEFEIFHRLLIFFTLCPNTFLHRIVWKINLNETQYAASINEKLMQMYFIKKLKHMLFTQFDCLE